MRFRPATIHRGCQLDELGPGLFVERCSAGAILHAEPQLLREVARRLGIVANPRCGKSGLGSIYVVASKSATAIELLLARAPRLIDARRAIANGYAPEVSNDH